MTQLYMLFTQPERLVHEAHLHCLEGQHPGRKQCATSPCIGEAIRKVGQKKIMKQFLMCHQLRLEPVARQSMPDEYESDSWFDTSDISVLSQTVRRGAGTEQPLR